MESKVSLSCAPHGEPPLRRRGRVEPEGARRSPAGATQAEAAGEAPPDGARRGVEAGPAVLRPRHREVGRNCAPGRPAPRSGAERDAQRFAERAVRAALEVLDGRRRAMHLRDIADPEVVAVLETYARTGERERRLGAAVLERVSCAPGARGRVEVFGRYRRGERVFAVAACLRAHRGGWRLCVLRVR
ncbi:Rv3235 family protein [Nocardia jiangsuensis]|uniref:Rv3235 family protein n=1 Tax=Nocardia jiangsuensis TaxID=1691563 RepID=A0ABV8DP30_9NOCA